MPSIAPHLLVVSRADLLWAELTSSALGGIPWFLPVRGELVRRAAGGGGGPPSNGVVIVSNVVAPSEDDKSGEERDECDTYDRCNEGDKLVSGEVRDHGSFVFMAMAVKEKERKLQTNC
ncbi:hypothetical protein EV421DRAFT_1732645 [Armillaria borealis]|uniref:Uncharacterized protein n=1 Tax=Armillaria borealis TaxID=47425 RepID=A0AA39MXE2_9AGAR|nr:hypothetical protein EV421DRAFT_1732645 [Armillaria borealis]